MIELYDDFFQQLTFLNFGLTRDIFFQPDDIEDDDEVEEEVVKANNSKTKKRKTPPTETSDSESEAKKRSKKSLTWGSGDNAMSRLQLSPDVKHRSDAKIETFADVVSELHGQTDSKLFEYFKKESKDKGHVIDLMIPEDLTALKLNETDKDFVAAIVNESFPVL